MRGRHCATSWTAQVCRWSQAAASLLTPEQEVMGWVHSCYARIINVRTPSGRLLTLQGEGMLQAPLGLALATDVAARGIRLPVGAPCRPVPTGSVQAAPTLARPTRGPRHNADGALLGPSCGTGKCWRSLN